MDFKDFKWTIATDYEVTQDGVHIQAPSETDYFVNPADGEVVANAPFFYKYVKGDFTLKAKVNLEFVSDYDACALLALDNNKLWAKACFEATDFDTKAVVTVMTNERSDDANGVNVEEEEIWLQISRKENTFAVHYSLDGDEYIMSRLAHLPMQEKIKVGFLAQSPIGKGGLRKFDNVSLELSSPEDIRKGV